MQTEIVTQTNSPVGLLSLPKKPSAALVMAADDLFKSPEHRIGITVTQSMHDEARDLIDATEEFLKPARPETVRRWLAAFGPTVAGRMPESEIRTRLKAYEIALDHPACCYTKRSLQSAARRFKFFPSVSELCTLFDEITFPYRDTMAKAKRVLKEPTGALSSRFVKSNADKDRVSQLVQQAKEALERGAAEMRGEK